MQKINMRGTFPLSKHKSRERKFCSEECAKKSVIIKKASELTCLGCGKEIGVSVLLHYSMEISESFVVRTVL
jgi:hypothetical protein